MMSDDEIQIDWQATISDLQARAKFHRKHGYYPDVAAALEEITEILIARAKPKRCRTGG